jgi:hypothetical protein
VRLDRNGISTAHLQWPDRHARASDRPHHERPRHLQRPLHRDALSVEHERRACMTEAVVSRFVAVAAVVVVVTSGPCTVMPSPSSTSAEPVLGGVEEWGLRGRQRASGRFCGGDVRGQGPSVRVRGGSAACGCVRVRGGSARTHTRVQRDRAWRNLGLDVRQHWCKRRAEHDRGVALDLRWHTSGGARV